MTFGELIGAWRLVRRAGRALKAYTDKLGGRLGLKLFVQHQVLKPLHKEAIHAAQQFGEALSVGDEDLVGSKGVDLCTVLKQQMSDLLETSPHGMHCCIKTLLSDESIVTQARSTPYDSRPQEMGVENARPISYSSVWCALMGRSDGATNWQTMDCFACDDLPGASAKSLFRCGRENWPSWYKSALVFPLRYPRGIQGSEYVVMGFLAFDTPKVGGFKGLPSIFDYSGPDQWTDYHDALDASAPFQLGAIFAHTLSAYMKPYYEARLADPGGSD